MVKMNIFQIFLLSSFIFQVFSLEKVIDEDKKIEDMKSSIWNSVNDGFYHLNQDLIPFKSRFNSSKFYCNCFFRFRW